MPVVPENYVEGCCVGPNGGGNHCSQGYGKAILFYLFIKLCFYYEVNISNLH